MPVDGERPGLLRFQLKQGSISLRREKTFQADRSRAGQRRQPADRRYKESSGSRNLPALAKRVTNVVPSVIILNSGVSVYSSSSSAKKTTGHKAVLVERFQRGFTLQKPPINASHAVGLITRRHRLA